MRDGLIESITAGIIGAVVKDILTIIPEKVLHLHPSYWDYGVYWVFMEHTTVIWKFIIGIGAEMWLSIALAFAYSFIRNPTHRITSHPYLLATMYGMSIWFTIRGIITIARISVLVPHEPWAVPINILIGTIYGIAIELIFKKFDKVQGTPI